MYFSITTGFLLFNICSALCMCVNPTSSFRKGDKISIKITQFGPLGASVTVDEGKAYGLCTQDQISWFRNVNQGHELTVGDVVDGAFVSGITEEGRIDVSLKEVGRSRIEVVQGIILDALEGSPDEIIPVGDKSAPEDIKYYFYGVSKSEFKQAVGALYKSGHVMPGKLETRLATEEESAAARARAVERVARGDVTRDSAKVASPNSSGQRGGKENSNSKNNANTLFVGNLPVSINEVILHNTMCKVLGEECIAGVRIPKRGDGYAQYGYVDLKSADLVPNAIEKVKGVQCMGRRLRADFAARNRSR